MFRLMLLLVAGALGLQGTSQPDIIAYTPRLLVDMPGAGQGMDLPGDLVLITPEGEKVAYLPTDAYDPAGLSWSANGTTIAITSPDALHIFDPDLHPVRLQAPAGERVGFNAVSDDGRTIVYTTRTENVYVFRLHAYDTHTGQTTQLTPNDLNVWGTVDWHDSDLLFTAVDLLTDTVALYQVNADGSELVNLTQGHIPDTYNVLSPVWDGETVAFTAGEHAQNLHLYLMDADGSHLRQITKVPGRQIPLTSFFGGRLVYAAVTEDPRSPSRQSAATLYLLDTITGLSTELTTAETIGGVDWSPDGTEIVYSPGTWGETADICIITLATLQERCLGVVAHWLAQPLWRQVSRPNP
ncbi:MAG: hypothetical protein OHK0046_21700 [Anaerolineae bacterium]